ncbi:hypothetical protein [Photobacterium damselae]|uniref:hypothetical protein n=1 Tax=Photobacterium damselae TaxID=38293 RepID=UPI0040689603
MSTRRERAQAFKEFSENSKSIFEAYWGSILSTDSLRVENDLNICPKGAMGGLDETLVEVFFGFKYHSWQKEVGDNFNVTNKANMIYGARLEYRLTDKSHVLCILRPSKTDRLKPYEDGILLDIVKEPSRLQQRSKTHWSYLISYMRATDVDGNPKIRDHFKTYWLRKTKRCFYNDKLATRKVIDSFNTVFGWAVSVGLSGGLIFLITTVINTSSQTETVGKLEQVANTLSLISTNQKLLLEEMKHLAVVTDNQEQLIEKQENANVYLTGIYRLSEESVNSIRTDSTFSEHIQRIEDELVKLNTETSAILQKIASEFNAEEQPEP